MVKTERKEEEYAERWGQDTVIQETQPWRLKTRGNEQLELTLKERRIIMKSFLLLIVSLTASDIMASSKVKGCKGGWVEFTCKDPKNDKEDKSGEQEIQENDTKNTCWINDDDDEAICDCKDPEVEEDGCQQPFNQTAYITAKTTITCDYPNKYNSSVKFFCKQNNNNIICEEILSTRSPVKSNGTFTLTDTNRGFNVSISNVSSQHAGVYWCGVKPNEGSYRASLRKINLEIKNIKTFTRSPSVGQTLTYWCKYEQQAPIKKFICKGEDPSICQTLLSTAQPNNNTGKFSIKDDKNKNIIITIRDLRANDSGTYWCGAYSTDKKKSHLFFTRLDMTVVIITVVCVAVLLLLLILVLVSKRCSRSKEKPKEEAQIDSETMSNCPGNVGAYREETIHLVFFILVWKDFVYEEIKENPNLPERGIAMKTIYVSANHPTNPSAFTHQPNIKRPNGSGEVRGDTYVNVKHNGQHLTYSTINHPSRFTEAPLYSRVGCEASSTVKGCKGGWVEFTCLYPDTNKTYKDIKIANPRKLYISIIPSTASNKRFNLHHDTMNKSVSLLIKQVEEEDKGEYKCQFKPNSTNDNVRWKLEDEEDGCQQPFNQNAYITAKTTITCDYPNKYNSSVKFFCKQNNNNIICEEILSTRPPVKSNGTFTLTDTNRGFNVSISNVSSQHAGVYWCGVKPNEGSYRASLRKINLEIKNIKTFTRSPSVGQNLTYWCKYPSSNTKKFICKGEDPSICQTLLSTAEPNNNTGKFSIKDDKNKNITITIRDLRANDSGTYWCGAYSTDKKKSHLFFTRLDMTVGLIILIITCVAALLLLNVIFIYRRKAPLPDYVYEEIQEHLQQPGSENAVNPIYATIHPTDPSASVHYANIIFQSTDKGDLKPRSSTCEYSTVRYSQSPVYYLDKPERILTI
ncbi:hypothetical protein PAMP_016871 [Pampus punctatissimus]